MKRSWIGFGLLLVLLMMGILSSWGMIRIHEPVEADLKQAAESALRGDWTNADYFSRRAEESWEDWEHFRACFADHTPVEEVGAVLASIEVYRASREDVAFAAACAEAAEKVEAVGDAHGLFWWNVL